MHCTRCKERDCYLGGKVCSSLEPEARTMLQAADNASIMAAAAAIEAEGYGKLTRLQEIAVFAKRMGYQRLGIAFCIGLFDEATQIEGYLKQQFEVYSVICKNCGIPKAELKLPQLKPERPIEATCNPIGQALILADCQTELNIIVGLCIGHDMLFTQYSKAPVTTLVVKDRVLAHNPVGALYSGYYRKKLEIP